MKNIEIVELGYPQSIIKRENEPISLIGTEYLVSQLQTRIKELEGTIENNVTEVSEFFNDGVEIFECNTCGMLMEANEPYNNYCPNCGRKIVR